MKKQVNKQGTESHKETVKQKSEAADAKAASKKTQGERPQSAKSKQGKQKGGKGKQKSTDKGGGASKAEGVSECDSESTSEKNKSDELKKDTAVKSASDKSNEESFNEKLSVESDKPNKIEDEVDKVSRSDNGAKSENFAEPATSPELTLEEKANLIKSPSSQSITRPPPDHTDAQEAVLDKLAGAATEKKVYLSLFFIPICYRSLATQVFAI